MISGPSGSSFHEFTRDGLIVAFVPDRTSLTVVFRGKSDSRSPSAFFDEFTACLLVESKRRTVNLDFRILEYMNSASVMSMLHLVRNLDTAGIETVLLFDKTSDWQRINLRCMKVITKSLVHVRVTD